MGGKEQEMIGWIDVQGLENKAGEDSLFPGVNYAADNQTPDSAKD